MTTNGVTLPRKLHRLKEAGLDSLNVSLDTLDPNRFLLITRLQGWERVMKSLSMALEMGFSPVKVSFLTDAKALASLEPRFSHVNVSGSFLFLDFT